MRLFTPLAIIFCALFFAPLCTAEDAAEFREKGIAALKDSQQHPRAIVDAARAFVRASELYVTAGDEEKAIEMNSFLYWCKKKMAMEDIDAFVKEGDAAVSNKLNAIEKLSPKADEAQAYLDRAEQFANKNPGEHLLIAIRFYEVADRFKGSDASMKAQDRSLKEQLQDKSTSSKGSVPPTAIRVPDTAPATVGSRPVPTAEDIKQAEKLVKDLLKEEYAKTDAPGRLALATKLMQQADENKGDPASEYVLLHEARDNAVAAGDVTLAIDAQKRLRDGFKMDFAAMLIDLRKLEATSKSADAATALATLLSLGADDALAVDNYDQAVRYNSRAEDLLPLIKNAAFKDHLKTEVARVLALKQASTAALAASKTLATKPDDPDANLSAGKFALQKGEFEKAFPLLAKSSDKALAGIAKRELTPSAEAPEQAKLGDDWFDLAAKESNAYLKKAMQERAGVWYGSALPALTGLGKLKVEGRMKLLSQTVALTQAAQAKEVSGKDVVIDLAGGIKMEFIAIPPGTFLMGSPPSEHGRAEDETLHTVRISKPFYMSKFLVTQEQYSAITNENPSVREHGPKRPVEMVSWVNAVKYCDMVSASTGRKFRLPTEAEWEYACRAGTKTRYNVGDTAEDLKRAGWYRENAQDITHDVGGKAPNSWGLYDMHGNVWEFCLDGKTDYSQGAQTDPHGPTTGRERVIRGGSLDNDHHDCRSAKRNQFPITGAQSQVGFRVVMEQQQEPDVKKLAGISKPASVGSNLAVPGEILSHLDPKVEGVGGQWTRNSDGTLNCRGSDMRLHIPYIPPEEYDLKVVFTWHTNGDGICFLMTQNGHRFNLGLGAWNNTASGISWINGQGGDHNSTRRNFKIVPEQKYNLWVKVRAESLIVLVDGKILIEHKSDGTDLTVENHEYPPDKRTLCIWPRIPATIHEIDVVDIKGKGEWIGSLPPPAPMERMGSGTPKKEASASAGNSLKTKELVLDLDTGVKLSLVLIQAGKFMMGGEGDKPHPVMISLPFYMGKYEVTQEQYELVLGETVDEIKQPKNPASKVSWDDAQRFCEKLNEKLAGKLPAGLKVGLPTEAQWEYACRAGTTTRYSSGNSEDSLDAVAWYGKNSGGGSHPVGEKKPNAWGLYDMHGNVWEWCYDWSEPYKSTPQTDPHGPSQGSERCMRGGNMGDPEIQLRSGMRHTGTPDGKYGGVGFRIIVGVPITKTP